MGQLLDKTRAVPNSEPDGKIIVFGSQRATDTPSLSAFVLKLETYLRMAKIEYTYGGWQGMSSKSKIPWMICDGTVVADSELCILHIEAKFGCELDKNLTTEQKDISRAISKMTEDNTYWCLVAFRFQHMSLYPDDTSERFTNTKHPSIVQKLFMGHFLRKVKNVVWQQGIGRHSEEEAKKILEDDLRALSDYLGGKPYFMGDEPTRVDCVVFGMLGSMVRWGAHEKNPGYAYLKDHCHNLWEYCDRMKTKFWPDWDECLYKPYDDKAEST